MKTKAAMMRAFYGNVSAGLKRASKPTKQRFLSSCILPIARSRWARWTYLPSYAARLNAFQRKLISVLFGIVPHSDEPYDAFCERRHNSSSAIARDMGLWSHAWANSVVNWSEHVQREHDPMTWSKHLLEWRGPEWLDLQRLLFSRPGHSRTHTRCIAGAPATRWLDGVASAKRALRLS